MYGVMCFHFMCSVHVCSDVSVCTLAFCTLSAHHAYCTCPLQMQQGTGASNAARKTKPPQTV